MGEGIKKQVLLNKEANKTTSQSPLEYILNGLGLPLAVKCVQLRQLL